ncbi:CDP-diacylglycerol--serine O-phosphatidyltransferase [Pseudomonas abieticivorans]|uniref:CDP-diacylglycerol--serine O-phosphatidyltransferase n=1 Tax=Pseudomonas abieticivorans TaxID=2931382 RepID=UPI0020C10ACF|nr:CDP-diacylglycerol--serine O-phosphatidyltransferase [Pseudomonas sp. PIA16]
MRPTSPRSILDTLPGFAMAADAISTLPGPADYRRCLLERIAGARRRIYIVALYLQQDEAGQELLDALYAAKAARPELDIVVAVDWFRAQRGLIGGGKQPGNAGWYQAERLKHGLEVPVYGVPIQTRELFGVLHLKGHVIDDCVIYSGASINNVYLQKFDQYRLDRYHVLSNPMLADAMQALIDSALVGAQAVHRLDEPAPAKSRSLSRSIRTFRSQLKRAAYDTRQAHLDTSGLRVIPLVGVGRNNPLNQALVALIAASQHRLTLCTPYFNLPAVLIREVNRALKRGVTIDIIMGDKTANDFYSPPDEPFSIISVLPYVYEGNLRAFARKYQDAIARGQLNLHLWKDGDNTFHLKGVWVDQRYTLLTGNNLNPRGFRLDLENALLIDDPQAEWAGPRDAELAQLAKQTTRIEHYTVLDMPEEYPAKVRTFLRRIKRARVGRMVNALL